MRGLTRRNCVLCSLVEDVVCERQPIAIHVAFHTFISAYYVQYVGCTCMYIVGCVVIVWDR